MICQPPHNGGWQIVGVNSNLIKTYAAKNAGLFFFARKQYNDVVINQGLKWEGEADMDFKRYITISNIALIFLVAALYFYGDTVLFVLVYLALFLFVSFRALQSAARKRTRFLLIVAYLIVLAIQMAFYTHIVAGYDYWRDHPLRKFFAIIIMLLPMVISRYVAVGKYTELYLPTLQEAVTISFSQLREFSGNISSAVLRLKKTGTSLTPSNFKEIIKDFPRHDSFHYINSGSLTDEYFQAARDSLDDPALYIVISNTGSPAGEILSVFTHRHFNHASLSFDASLKTVVSYNGGERIYPPGLNSEMADYLARKPDASVLVYRLPVTREQKAAALEKILQVNQEGSSYNLLGLFINKSYKPNIMYCSQFVYSILRHIGATYFEASGKIKPTDLVEKDYQRKLEFVEELRLYQPNSINVAGDSGLSME